MLAVGLLGTAMTQGLIAYAASAAAPHEQGRVVGAAQSGVFIGLLLARVFAGAVSDLAGWRGVYLCAAALIALALALPLWRRLPALAPSANAMRYPTLLASMLTLLRRERALQVRGMLALLMFAAFNIFWSALVLPLSARRSTTPIPPSAPLAWWARLARWLPRAPDSGPTAARVNAPARRRWRCCC
ncbi:MFS transporter [Chromobacterium haemolyticum]|nr:MFS transporter [Chromobacterium haemolyticum]